MHLKMSSLGKKVMENSIFLLRGGGVEREKHMLSHISQLHLFMIIAQACRSNDAECTVGTQPLLSGRQNSSCLAGVNPLARSHSILVQSAAVLFSTAASPAMRQRAATDKGSWPEAPARSQHEQTEVDTVPRERQNSDFHSRGTQSDRETNFSK